jgi:hypothetical protein
MHGAYATFIRLHEGLIKCRYTFYLMHLRGGMFGYPTGRGPGWYSRLRDQQTADRVNMLLYSYAIGNTPPRWQRL